MVTTMQENYRLAGTCHSLFRPCCFWVNSVSAALMPVQAKLFGSKRQQRRRRRECNKACVLQMIQIPNQFPCGANSIQSIIARGYQASTLGISFANKEIGCLQLCFHGVEILAADWVLGWTGRHSKGHVKNVKTQNAT